MFNKDERERKTVIYKVWRNAVLERDGYVCQYPGCSCKKDLQVHHIMPFRKKPEARFSLSNGITYCKKHHELVEKISKRGGKDERILNPLQYNEQKRYNKHKPQFVWKNYRYSKKRGLL